MTTRELTGARAHHLRSAEDIRALFPRMEILSDQLCQTQGAILKALEEAGLTVVLLIHEDDAR